MKHVRHTIDCEKVVPEFVASYLRVAGDECAFVDTNTALSVPILLDALAQHGLAPEQVRWVIVTHAHLDHAGGAGALLAKCPNAKLVAHPRAARHLVDPSKLIASAKGVYGEAVFASVYGDITPVPAHRSVALEDGGTFELGDATFAVRHTAGHAKHHFVIHDPAMQTVYAGDTFGLAYPRLQRAGRFAFASTSPTDFDAEEAHLSLGIVRSLGAKIACLTHFGDVSDLDEVAAQVGDWVERSDRLVRAASTRGDDAGALTAWLSDRLRHEFAEKAARHSLSLDGGDWSMLELDVNLNAQGLAIAASRARGEAR